jgi:ribosomal-protein-alanine N-acetyltransferase
MNASVDLSKVTLESERLWLRPFCQADLEDFYAYARIKGCGEWAGWAPHENIEESQRILDRFIAEKKTFALVLKESGRVVGSLGLEPYRMVLPDLYEAKQGRELGYVLAKDQWGQGLMSEAVARVIRYCFDELGFDFLVCCHFVRNYRSERVISKNGFVYYQTLDYETSMGTHEPTRCYLLQNPKKNS